jgi:hypothetical protein
MAAGVIIFAVITNNTFVTIESVERVLQLPVLMAVPRLPMPKGSDGRPAAA